MNKFTQTLFWNNYKKFNKVVGNSSMRCTVDAIIYWKLFKNYNFSNILEVGVYQGLTTGLMLESSNNIKSYTGIDPELKLDLFNKIWQNYLDDTKFYTMYSENFTPRTTYDFILIDGDHRYEQALSDLLMANSALESTGILAIDDYNLPEVAKAIDEFKKHTTLVPFLQAEQTEFWHFPSNDRSNFLDNLLQDTINNFIFMYNINNSQILKAKTLHVFTNELDLFDQVLRLYDI